MTSIDTQLLDTITIVSVILNFILLFIFGQIWKVRDLIKAGLQATTRLGENNHALGISWETDNRIRLYNPHIDEKDPFKWHIKRGKSTLPLEIKKGHVRTGPDNIDYVLMTDDCTSTLNPDTMTASKVGSTPGYVQTQIDLAYSDGFQDGWNRSNSWSWFDSLNQNWTAVVTIILVLMVAGTVMYDKVITSPGCYSTLQNVQEKNDRIIAMCSPYLDIDTVLPAQDPEPPKPPETGGAIQ